MIQTTGDNEEYDRIPYFYITGGDPILHPDFWELMVLLKSKFDLTIEKVGCLNRAAIKSVIMSTVSKTNMNEIPNIIDEVVKAKVKVFAFYKEKRLVRKQCSKNFCCAIIMGSRNLQKTTFRR